MKFSIPPQIIALAHHFNAQHFKLYLVGGSVRDFMLGQMPSDFDFCTDALPHETRAILQDFGKTRAIFSVGEKFGTIGAMICGTKIEITTFRSERDYADNRHPKFVRFESEIFADLKRRDFTINAMAFEILSGKITDIFGGVADLRAQKICAVGNANKRFSEDALRILRAFSFVAKFGFEIDSATMGAIIAQKSLLKNISKERISAEISKILKGRFALKALQKMQEILPLKIPKNFHKIPANRRIYAIFLIFDEIFDEMQITKRQKTIKEIFIALDSAQRFRKVRDLRRFLAELRMRFEVSDLQIALSILPQNGRFKKAFRPKILRQSLKINGFDLQNLGFTQMQIGAVKSQLLREIYSGDLPNTRAILLCRARDLRFAKSR
ncbi:CCA tRNA nucleotidyltransferase [Helicobacter sp. 23-1044]